MGKSSRRSPRKALRARERKPDFAALYREALERQTATGAILAAISSSVEDARPVFDAIAQSALKIFGGMAVGIALVEGDELHSVVEAGDLPRPRRDFRMPLDRQSASGLAVLDRKPVNIADTETPSAPPFARANGRAAGFRAVAAAPMLRNDAPVGSVVVLRKTPGALSDKQLELLQSFAAQAVIAIENARLFNETKDALERQRASADILRIIARSPGNIQPVLEAMAETVARLCGASDVLIRRLDGDQLRMAAHFGSLPITVESHACTRESVAGRAVLERRTMHVEDILSPERRAEFPDAPAVRRPVDFHTILAVPLVRNDSAIGVILLRRVEARLFSEQQVALLESFADQAVIAIENARLFNETKEALEQQTATAEILSVISATPTDTQPVFEAIARSALRIFGGMDVGVGLVDGDEIEIRASTLRHADKGVARRIPLNRDTALGRAILERGVTNIGDIEAPDTPPLTRERGRATGWRSVADAPMLREGVAIGFISVHRAQPGPLSEKQMALLKTFADQAVIAIENVRLFNETKEALERQTATAEILKVISSSTTDTQPVFEAIVRSAARLFPSSNASIFMRDGDLMRLHAVEGATVDDAVQRELASIYPIRFNPEVSTSARAMVERRINICLDTEAPDVPEHIRRAGRAGRFRSNTVMPLVRDDEGIGTIVITHPQPGHRLNEKQLALLRTFADQAVIAIENTRLFNETREALDQQKASAEVLGAISGSIADTQPVFEKILASSERLFAGELVGITLADGDTVRLAAYRGPQGEPLSRIYPLPLSRESGTGWAILNAAIAHFPDIEAPGVPPGVVAGCRALKVRAIVFAPMLFEGKGIGAIWVARSQAGPFSEKQISQLRTFADQAVIAIQNARLFREIREKSSELEIANRHKSEFLANMSHELRTPLNAIIGFSEVLLECMFGEVNEKQADYLKDIHESGRHLLSLINDILDLSKIEAGRMELELSRFHLPSAIGNALTLVRERAQRHGIQLGQEIDPALGEVEADERKVKQILLNLLSNAVKFTPEGGHVDVSAKLDTDRVEIAVKDTGVGIAPEDQAALFEEFRQVGRDGPRKAEGTGLGLALTKKFVELHGGAVRVESAPGKGSTFSFSLPLAGAARPASSD